MDSPYATVLVCIELAMDIYLTVYNLFGVKAKKRWDRDYTSYPVCRVNEVNYVTVHFACGRRLPHPPPDLYRNNE